MMIENIKIKLEKYNQEHLLNFYGELNENEKKHLIDQVNVIDFDLIENLYSGIGKVKEEVEVTSMSSFSSRDDYAKVGLECMKNGEYALVTMAGGQGTRLGFDGPKGTYMLDYGINKSLFEIQCDKLMNIYKMCNVYTSWYIMTSYENNDATVEFFEQNNYFNYPKDRISFFIQDELPMIDINGKILMDSKSNIKMGANGHGGIFLALTKNGIIEKMKRDNVKWIFIGGIDNILLPVDNPDLVGFSVMEDFLVSSMIVEKGYPDEKVGVFCKKNGKPSVIEYIEMTPEMNNLKDDNGNLVYGDAHILCNLFNISVLDSIANKNLPYISALKKADYINELGELVVSEFPNAYKFEMFIFDAFSYVEEVGLLKGLREEIFAPIKNASGVDSPNTASSLYIAFNKNK